MLFLVCHLAEFASMLQHLQQVFSKPPAMSHEEGFFMMVMDLIVRIERSSTIEKRWTPVVLGASGGVGSAAIVL